MCANIVSVHLDYNEYCFAYSSRIFYGKSALEVIEIWPGTNSYVPSFQQDLNIMQPTYNCCPDCVELQNDFL